MAPKAATPAKVAMGSEGFLAACIKHAKEKPQIDFEALAGETGMSKGGAQNKFRAIMKQFEDEKGTSSPKNGGSDGTASPTTAAPKKTAAKRKTPAKNAKAKPADDADDHDNEDDSTTPNKKVKRTTKKTSAKAKKTIVKQEEDKADSIKEEENDDNEETADDEELGENGQVGNGAESVDSEITDALLEEHDSAEED